MWWDYKIPRLENWLRPDKSSLSGPDQALLESIAMDSGFHNELLPFITNENIQTINSISSNTSQKILADLKSPFRLITIGVLSLCSMGAIFYMFFAANQPEPHYQPRTETFTPAFAEGPDFELPVTMINLQTDEPGSVESVSAPEPTTTPEQTTPLSVVSDDPVKTKQVIDPEEKRVKRSKSVTGYKIAEDPVKTKTTRDPQQPMLLQRVDIARKENYWVYLNNSNDISYSPTDMPNYSGGDSRLTDDIAYYIRQATLNERYEEPVSVLLSFVIDPKGKMEDIVIKHSSTDEIESTVRKALGKLELWQRGHKIGKKGSMYYEIAISFN